MKILITTGQGPRECEYFLQRAVPIFAKEARLRGLSVAVEHMSKGSVLIDVSGDMKDWIGVWEWVSPSPFRPKHKRKRWFIEAKRVDDCDASLDIRLQDIVFQTLRAGGPGGQHQNKRESAVRASWTAPDGRVFSCVSRQERSQHRNKSLAIEMLKVQVEQEGIEKGKEYSQGRHRQSKSAQRGGAVKSFKDV